MLNLRQELLAGSTEAQCGALEAMALLVENDELGWATRFAPLLRQSLPAAATAGGGASLIPSSVVIGHNVAAPS